MRLLLVLVMGVASACGDGDDEPRPARDDAPRQALPERDEEALLASEAARRGYGDRPEVRLAGRRAMVQALLEREVEAVVTPESIPETDARARWQESERWNRPERRATKHVLARVPEDAEPATVLAAEEIARDAIAALSAAWGDPTAIEAVAAELRGVERDGVSVVVEDLTPYARDAPLEGPYREAMFSIDGPGVVPQPVRTSYGFHAIVVTEIVPALAIPFEEAEADVRAELATERRRERLDAFLEDLRDRYEIRIDETAVREALAQDLFEER